PTPPNTHPARRSCPSSSRQPADGGVEERFYAEYAEIQDRHWWFVGRRRLIGAVLASDLPASASGRRVLDLGCGTGTMLGELRRFGDVHGVDTEPAAVEYCHAHGEPQVELASG